MRTAITLAVALAASGCAARSEPARIISTSWSAVEALTTGTEVEVVLDGGEVRSGRVHAVTADTLTVWERRGAAAIPRLPIARVSVRTANGTARGPGFVKTTLG